MSELRSLGELQNRIKLTYFFISVLNELDNPRQAEALKEYRGQEQILADEIKKHYGAEHIPPKKVRVKAAKLFGKGGI